MRMSGIIKVTMTTFVVILLLIAGFYAMAEKPAYTGVKCPPAVDGKTGAVTGRVTSAINTTGMASAYIGVVNASNSSEEYYNTTSDANGYYQILGINASYNATDPSDVGPNGPTPYRIYAYHPIYGEGYSSAFGIDASGGPSSPGSSISPITVTSTPTAAPTPVSTPTPTPIPTSAPTTTPSITATMPAPTATPQPTPYLLSPILSLLFAGFIATWMISRHKKN